MGRPTFSHRIVFVGFGAVARCTLPILLKHMDVDPRRITIMDFDPNHAALKPWIDQGVTFVEDKVTEDNMGALLGKYLSAGDLLIDLAWNIDCVEIVQWCHDRGILYINTSVELWDPYAGAENKPPTERTLYWRHMKLRKMVASWSQPGPTAVIEHGANPGLISHFTKHALLDIAAPIAGGSQVHRRRCRGDRASRQGAGVQPPRAPARRQGHSLQRARHAGQQSTEGSRRVRQYVERRGLPRRGHDDGGARLGHARKRAAGARLRASRRPEEPDLPGAHGHQHLRRHLGAARPSRDRHGRPPRRGVHHHREAHRVGERQGRLPADRALRLLPVRQRHRLAVRAARPRLRAAAARAHHDRRDHDRCRHPRRAGDGPSVPVMVVRDRSRHRGIAASGAASECDDDAGRDLGGGGRVVDAREPGERPPRP